MELALVRLSDATGHAKYRALAGSMVEMRGRKHRAIDGKMIEPWGDGIPR